MKTLMIKFFLLLTILAGFRATAQNNLFEKVYQNGFTDYNYKFLKRSSVGFAVFSESIAAINGPYLSSNSIFTCNDTGFVTQQIALDATIPYWGERFEIIDWHIANDGNYLVNYKGTGCDFGVNDSSLIFKLSPTGNLIWYCKGLLFGEVKTGLIKYLNSYLNYNFPPIYAPTSQNVKLMFCSENGNRRPIAEFANNNYIELYSNEAKLYAIKQDTTGNESILHIDTLGTIYQNFLLGTNADFFTKRAYAYHQNKIIVSFNNVLYQFNDTLGQMQQLSLSNNIIRLQFDAAGNTWALLENGELMSFDTSLNPLSATNLISTTTNINSVNWFEIDIPTNRIYYGGLATNKPFLKSMELSTFNHFQNANNIKVTATQISNASGSVTYLQPTAPVYRIFYQFDVAATVKNTGNTVVNRVFLNCSAQIGSYYCNAPFLIKQFTNLNLLPGDSINLFIGNYIDSNIYVPITNISSTYTRHNFCVWPSAPNDTWTHDTIQQNCQNIQIVTLVGVNLNKLEDINTSITISPNPSNDKLLVNVPANFKSAEILIIDITGNIITQFNNIQNSSFTIDVATLPNGIYFLQLNDGKNMVRKKFVKSN